MSPASEPLRSLFILPDRQTVVGSVCAAKSPQQQLVIP